MWPNVGQSPCEPFVGRQGVKGGVDIASLPEAFEGGEALDWGVVKEGNLIGPVDIPHCGYSWQLLSDPAGGMGIDKNIMGTIIDVCDVK